MSAGLEFVQRGAWPRATVVCLVVGVLGSVFALWQRHQLLEGRDAAVSRRDARQQALARSRPLPVAAVQPEARAEADRLVAGLRRSWEPMLDALQSALQDDVQIQRVQPEADALRLRIAGLADNSEAFIAFVQRLRSDPSWRSVEPLSEAKQPDAVAGAGAGGKPLAFQLAAQWRES